MMTVPTFAEKLAVRLLAREGISAVWQLHVAAATAYRDGYKRAAETVLEIADAAERELLGRGQHAWNSPQYLGGFSDRSSARS